MNLKKILTFTFIIVLTIYTLSLSTKIIYMQNDDWYYYKQVELFNRNNFQLIDKIAPTFYLQGIIALIFTKLTGLKLHILTAIISILCTIVFYKILDSINPKAYITNLLLSLLLFFNPLFNYSIWGFMTENYFLLLFLISILFSIKFFNSKDIKFFYLTILFTLLSFFVKQVGLFLLIPLAVQLIVIKHYKLFTLTTLTFLLTYLYYMFIFPQTNEMRSKNLSFTQHFNLEYINTLHTGIFVYLIFFSLPLVVWFVLANFKITLNYIIKFILISLVLNLLVFYKFNPDSISWGEFPYFENTFERTGYFPRSISGTKYQFRGIYDFYYYSEKASKLLLILLLSTIILNYRILLREYNSYLIYITLSYLGLITFVGTFFDRYMIPLIPIFIIFLYKNIKLQNTLFTTMLIIHTAIFVFVFHNFTIDFIENENFIWETSLNLTKNRGENIILSSSAWNEKYIRSKHPEYIITYDSQKINADLNNNYLLIKEFSHSNRMNFFINPKIYVYKIK